VNSDLINSIGKWVVAVAVIGGCFVLLYTGRSTDTQPWTIIGLVTGWIVRDSAGTAATTNAVKTIQASQAATV
jgi:steroid 5-alpha reductase family enzyme